MANRSRVLSIVLAGGTGGRLRPLTEKRAKPAVPFAGTYRLVDFALSNLTHSGLTDVWLIEQYEPHALNDHLANGRPWDLDRTHGGFFLLPPYQGEEGEGFAEGNADALARNRRAIREFAPDVVLVLSADHVYTLDYRDVLDFHHARGGELTMVVKRIDDDPSSHGVVELEGERVTGFEYKPERPRTNIVTTEIFVYDARSLLETLDAQSDEELKDFGHRLVPDLVSRGTVRAYEMEGYWRDVGTIPAYWRAHMDLIDRPDDLRLDDPAWPIWGKGLQRLPARVTGTLDRALISSGCQVEGKVTRSVLGPGVRVEAGAEVTDSVILEDAVVRSGARVRHAVIAEGVSVEGTHEGTSDTPYVIGSPDGWHESLG